MSYVRKEFRATAESRKRPPLIAEAMVDADVEIRGVIAKGKLLALTTDEALKHKLADFRADTLASALEKLGLGGAELRHAAAIDLAGRNVLEAVQMSVLPKVIETPRIAAVAKDGIQLIVVSRVTA